MSRTIAQLKSAAKREGWAQYINNDNDERALRAGCFVDERFGKHVCDFFEQFLCHFKGEWAGQPFKLADVQRDKILMPLFSWRRPDGTRRFRAAQIWVPKKNFKSTMASGLTIYGLVGDDEPGAEVYCIANDRDQAGIVYNAAADMVESSPQLAQRLDVRRSQKSIRYGTSAWIKALSAEAKKQEGHNASMVICDELHVFDEYRGRQLYSAMRFAGAARRQPLHVVISTAGDNDLGLGFEEYDRAKSVLKGDIEDWTTFVFIAEADKDDDPAAIETWEKANPMWGITIKESEMRDSWQSCIGSPRAINDFKRYRLNQWIGTSEPWLDMDKWGACGEYAVEPYDLEGCRAFGGLDLAVKTDLSAWSLCFPPSDEGEPHRFLWHFWIPEAGIVERERRDRIPYREYAERGLLTITPGDVTDYGFIREYILSEHERFDVPEFAFDPKYGRDLCQRLHDEDGLSPIEFIQYPSNFSEPTKYFERLVQNVELAHGNNPLMRAQASQATVKTSSQGYIHPVKGDGRKKWYRIDGIVAAIMALQRAMAGGETVLGEDSFCVV